MYNGLFTLIGCWTEQSGSRKVFKFKLQLSGISEAARPAVPVTVLEEDRLIPSLVKLEVWKRDKGRCVECSATSGLHFEQPGMAPVREATRHSEK